MTTLAYAGTLTVRTCWCGIRHAIPEELSLAADRNKSLVVFCPVGHEWVSGSHELRESDRLREWLEQERDRSARIAAERDQVEASLRATKGVITKMRKRASAGMCPCCQRTFQQLARHMASQHPGFVEATS